MEVKSSVIFSLGKKFFLGGKLYIRRGGGEDKFRKMTFTERLGVLAGNIWHIQIR